MIELRPGDVFCTENPMMLGRAINAVQRFFDPDDESKYSHAGIIISRFGDTFEALWTIKKSDLSKYVGKQIVIGRNKNMTFEKFETAYAEIMGHDGYIYPVHRLAFFLIPPLAKYFHPANIPVCSELAAKFLYHAGILKNWAGKNPNYVADMIIQWRTWEIVYEGVWE
ncbi:MAG: hypothetical protein RBT11_14230 [Desulfobacterales bacterium]|jgi:hypothetical protein|nr:hypothetical protein [Desulfobacterales bacterium]